MIVPGIPCGDLVWVSKGAEREEQLLNSLPPLLRRPLQKSEHGSVIGAQSGVRSGIVKASDGKFYRLKGCGNNYAGFPTRQVKSPTFGDDCIEIRGCTFKWTCLLEEHMTSTIGQALSPETDTANRSRGWFIYDVPNDPFPLVPKYCAVFECLGDKRLGDHVLRGLDRLLGSLVPTDFDQSLLPAGADRMETMMLAQCDMYDSYIAINDLPLPLQTPAAPADLDDKWRDIWASSAALLDASSSSSAKNTLLAQLYWRFGWEAGQVLKRMHAVGINWGTYVDELGIHCNAHINNLVIRPFDPAYPERPWLAPLDYDMAFTEDIFLLLSGADTSADATRAMFDEWKILEHRGLECCLAGSDLNSGTAPLEDVPEHVVNVRWALRDTACLAFRMAFFTVAEDPHPLIPEQSAVAHALIRLALLATTDVVA